MRWIPSPVCDGTPAYDTFTLTWTASATARYCSRLGAPRGVGTATKPTSFDEMLAFEVPDSADMFGLEFQGKRNGAVGAATIVWTNFKLEVFAFSANAPTTEQTFALDSGDAEEPFIWVPCVGNANTSSTNPIGLQNINRQFFDASGSDLALPTSSMWLRPGAQTVTAVRRKTVWFSPFGPGAGIPYVGHYDRFFINLNFTPNASITAEYTMTVRPVAVKLNDGGGGSWR